MVGLMCSNEELNVEMVNELCKAQQRLMLSFLDDEGSPWIRFTATMHEVRCTTNTSNNCNIFTYFQLYGHLPGMIRRNRNTGLRNMSEENLESMHKTLKRWRISKARLFNPEENLEDLMLRLAFFNSRKSLYMIFILFSNFRANARSDPVVRGYRERTYKCSVCHEKGESLKIVS